ncbi:MAG: sulfurtransferase TusA family protein [Alphaproteobacteria bacterium]|nr:sulfurtransferase TusA family protein [Alphaproteobacteria bacterium]
MSVKETLDLVGLKCPLPALLAKRALLRAPQGSLIEVVCDDPLAGIDVPHMCRSENFEVVCESREGAVIRLTLRRP